jgi:large subunit ribosomal protein L15
VPVNVGRLAAKFAAGDEVTPQALVDKGIVKNTKTPIKILGGGELGLALTVRMHGFSEKAIEKIEAAGGKAELLA